LFSVNATLGPINTGSPAMTVKRHHPRVIVLGASVLLFTACGEGDSSDTTPIDIEEDTMELFSEAFEMEGSIPVAYTCDGEGSSPPLGIAAIPPETRSLALIVDDPDAPRGTWDHWVAFDIPPTDAIPGDVGSLGTAGSNSSGTTGYDPPCPPSGTHRYVFRIYALDTELGLAEGANKTEVLDAMEGHVLGEGTLVGMYGR
jgi:Raf kinase inhibitor-like YbhB/YbcL family protein